MNSVSELFHHFYPHLNFLSVKWEVSSSADAPFLVPYVQRGGACFYTCLQRWNKPRLQRWDKGCSVGSTSLWEFNQPRLAALRATSCCLRSWVADMWGVANVCSVLRLWCVHDPGCTQLLKLSAFFSTCFWIEISASTKLFVNVSRMKECAPRWIKYSKSFFLLLLFLCVLSLKCAFQNGKRLKRWGCVFQQPLDSDLCLLVWV